MLSKMIEVYSSIVLACLKEPFLRQIETAAILVPIYLFIP